MKKAIDQTVRDLKRGVNKKVLKVPVIEQKVLDATSNESWGPHGSLLADIAQATRNYHEHQIIMSIIWKRINDTGKNWRHVYKGLIVLEYLVAHGSERVIDDIREHAFQISTLSDFQYIDSSGKDQGNNVRRKSQSLVVLVNDKERIQEAREKAAANRDKYRGPPTSGMYRPGSGGYGDRYNDDTHEGRYRSRDDERNGYERDREWGTRDDDRYGRNSYGRDGDRYGRDYEDRYGQDGYRDDDYNYNARSRSADRERDRANEEDSQFSSRVSAKAGDHSEDGRFDRKSSGQNLSVPPSYEDAVNATHSPTYNDRDGASKELSPPGASPSHTTAAAPNATPASPPTTAPAPHPASAPTPASSQSALQHSRSEVDGFDEFDPRGSFSAATATSNVTAPAVSSFEMDLLGSLSESFSSNTLALLPSIPSDMNHEANGSAITNPGLKFVAASSASPINNQSFDDPFGDGPFKATPTEGAPIQPQITTPLHSVNANSSQTLEASQPAPQMAAYEFDGSYYDANYAPTDSSGAGAQPSVNTEFPKQELSTPNQEFDILADILPPSAPSSFVNAPAGYPLPPSQSVPHGSFPTQPIQSAPTDKNASQNSFHAQTGQPAGFPTQVGQPSAQYPLNPASSVIQPGQTMPTTLPLHADQSSQMGFHPQGSTMQLHAPQTNFYGAYNSQSTGLASAYANPLTLTGHTTYHNDPQMGSAASMAPKMGPQPAQVHSGNILAAVSSDPSSTGFATSAPQPSKDKFETKSSVWAETLSRGLVNLNISGPKTNPLADIGVDFDAINRKEKRMEKPTTSTVTSTVTMGKAMGSGSGLGRAGAGALRGPPNPMMNSGMNMGMGGGPGAGIGMGGYGGNQPTGMGMGMSMNMGMNMPGNMGMGMNTQQQQQPMGYPSRASMPGSYVPTTGAGNYAQQPYGGYR